MSASGARPKRNAEAAARYQSPEAKKPRFDYRNPSTLAPDAPEEDSILELDEIGKGGLQTKRNAVKLDGYESDSSDDNFDARADAKAEQDGSTGATTTAGWNVPPPDNKKSRDEEEDDMFADVEEGTGGVGGTADGHGDEELRQEGKKAKKDVRFMDIQDIEGQVGSSKSGGHVSADFTLSNSDKGKGKLPIDQDVESSSDSGTDEERDRIEAADEDAEELGAGSKKKHAPRLDAFHMQQEGEEGRFDDAGNFIRKAVDPDSVHDSWLEGLSKKDMKKAKEAQEKRDQERRRQTAEDDAILTSQLLSTLITHLQKAETPLEALQRLNAAAAPKQKQKKLPKWKQKKQQEKQDQMDIDADTGAQQQQPDPVEQRRLEAVEAVTAAADSLFSRNNQDIYDHERELLIRLYKRETGDDWQEPRTQAQATSDVADAEFEFRWADARDGGASHGPYDANTMRAWQQAGYFGQASEVEFRRIGHEEWSRSLDILD